MSKEQVNIRLEKELVVGIEELIKTGHFSSKTDAFSEAAKMLIKTYKGDLLAKKIDSIREGTEKYSSPAEAVTKSHEEEDTHSG
jgi:Arc/MetJ-type ribon-helix-helix transcriptional regulator